jgi:hypothetical protein
MGRIPTGKSGASNGIGYLWPHHRSMARDLIAGFTPGEVADKSGFTAAQITRITQSPLFIAELNRLAAQAEDTAVDVHEDFRRMSTRAAEILDENLHGEEISRGLKTKTAFDVLDRAGYGKKEKPSLHLHAHAHEVRKVHDMDTEELYEEIIDLVEEE